MWGVISHIMDFIIKVSHTQMELSTSYVMLYIQYYSYTELLTQHITFPQTWQFISAAIIINLLGWQGMVTRMFTYLLGFYSSGHFLIKWGLELILYIF